MSDIKDGGPAFPAHWNGLQPAQQGMTLRDWFAGQALAGQLSIPTDATAEDFAKSSYAIADAMLAALEKKK